MKPITTCLWFDTEALDAARFYVSVFPGSKLGAIERYGDAFPDRAGQVLTVQFQIPGQRCTALNGGPQYKFTAAISLVVRCDSQAEIDRLWRKLVRGGRASQCGWLVDKFGVSWQIVPSRLAQLLRRPGAVEAMLGMQKLDIAALERAGQPARRG